LFINCFSDFGILLAEFAVGSNYPLARAPNCPSDVQQLAAVLLRQYVEKHWCGSMVGEFETTARAKRIIKCLLPYGLRGTVSKV
jgi:hypothetical protein